MFLLQIGPHSIDFHTGRPETTGESLLSIDHLGTAQLGQMKRTFYSDPKAAGVGCLQPTPVYLDLAPSISTYEGNAHTERTMLNLQARRALFLASNTFPLPPGCGNAKQNDCHRTLYNLKLEALCAASQPFAVFWIWIYHNLENRDLRIS